MKLISDYTVSILVVSALAILFENILPDGNNKKFCRIIIGLSVMLIILTPLTRLPHYNETFRLPELRLNSTNITGETKSYIAENFEKKLSLTIAEDIRQTFGTAVSCRIVTEVNESGQITDIRHVILSPHTQKIATYIAQKYGLKEANITP